MNETVQIAGVVLIVLLLTACSGVLGFLLWIRYRKKFTSGEIARRFTSLQPYLLLAFLIIFILASVASTVYYSKDFLPEPVSVHGKAVVPLFNATTILTGIAFFLTQVLLFFFAFHYRTKPGKQARFFKEKFRLELFWILVSAFSFIFLFIWGQILWAKMQHPRGGDPPEGTVAENSSAGEVLEIDVMGQQFGWKVRYPGADGQLGRTGFRYMSEDNGMGIDVSDPHSRDDFIPVQMHIPKNRPVRLLLRSKDVIHSFFIPHLRVKMDALPGMTTRTHFTATATTAEMRERLNKPDFNFEVACAELCGRMHFAMKLILVVDEPEQFEKWYEEQNSWMKTAAAVKGSSSMQ